MFFSELSYAPRFLIGSQVALAACGIFDLALFINAESLRGALFSF